MAYCYHRWNQYWGLGLYYEGLVEDGQADWKYCIRTVLYRMYYQKQSGMRAKVNEAAAWSVATLNMGFTAKITLIASLEPSTTLGPPSFPVYRTSVMNVSVIRFRWAPARKVTFRAPPASPGAPPTAR